jgi:hypothetical protein
MSLNVDSRICSTGCGTSLVLNNISVCNKKAWRGRISELLLIDCTLNFTEANLTDLAWWTSGITSGKIISMQGIGSTDQVLKVTAGIPAWATPAAGGGMTLLSTTTMSGAVTTISSISGSYKQLYVIWYGMTNATGSGYMEMKFNNTGNYSGNKSIGSSGSATAQAENNVSIVRISYGTTNNTNANNFAAMTINDYASTSNRKTFTVSYSYSTSEIIDYTGAFLNNAAISELNFSNTGGDWTAGTVKIYGVN